MAVADWDQIAIVNIVLLFCLMLGLGAAIDFNAFTAKFNTPTGIVVCALTQFTVLPALAYGIGKALDLDPIYAVSLVVLGCCPGGAASNILTFVLNADLPLSVAMTTASSAVSTFMLPLNIYIYTSLTGLASGTTDDGLEADTSVSVEVEDVVVSALVVVVGTLTGIVLQLKCSKEWAMRFAKFGTLAGAAVILIAIVSNGQSDTPVWESEAKNYGAAILQTATAYLIGLILTTLVRLPRPSRVAICIELSLQNQLLAISILNVTFKEQSERDEAAIVPVTYIVLGQVMNLLMGGVLWRGGWLNVPSDASCGEFVQAYGKVVDGEAVDGVLAVESDQDNPVAGYTRQEDSIRSIDSHGRPTNSQSLSVISGSLNEASPNPPLSESSASLSSRLI